MTVCLLSSVRMWMAPSIEPRNNWSFMESRDVTVGGGGGRERERERER